MSLHEINVLNELVRTGSILLSREMNYRELITALVEQSIDITRSDLSALYLYSDIASTGRHTAGTLRLVYRRGRHSVPTKLDENSSLVSFIKDSKEAVTLNERHKSPFVGLLLSDRMSSGVAFPLTTPKRDLGILFLNSIEPFFYNRTRFNFLDSLTKLTGGLLHNSRLFQELKESLDKILEMERYQENIFSSMSNWLVATDQNGDIRYFNYAAAQGMDLDETAVGKNYTEVFQKKLDPKLIRMISKTSEEKKTVLGLQGICTVNEKEVDFALNINPLLGHRKQHEGLTLIFRDQSREQELQKEVEGAIEERRMIKDMFARYLSQDLVHNIMQQPDLIKPGGSVKTATVFFADIRGYTSFSEKHTPEYIIEVLNEYFQVAVELVVKSRGYIDKFIGDCIMAAWGVPLDNPKKDAIAAVGCAVEIQKLVASKNRTFFLNEAKDLRIGIGMHTGPLVAGNLGSDRKMNYTVIGDTVNLASRLEGISKADEIIITQDTKDLLGGRFRLKAKPPVQVKGKEKPIPIFSVIDYA